MNGSRSGLVHGTPGTQQTIEQTELKSAVAINETNIPVSKLGDVRYNRKKTEGYLLNINHPVGGAKARFMRDVLGYTNADSKLFHKNVVSSIIGKNPIKRETTKFGTKHTYKTKLKSKSGSLITANIVVVIQKDNGRITHKIVTVYPDKKE